MSLALYALATLYALWCAYVLVMGLYRAELAGRLVGLNRLLAWPVLACAVALDAAVNLALATLVFADRPREWLLTARLQRYKAGPAGWRRRVADWLCEHLLDPFDPTGDHC